jgi:glycine oxidase
MLHTDICIAGAGIIGLSIALELQARKLNVIVVEAGLPLSEASTAAAGMLAAEDPHNPAELLALSQHSISIYSEFLDRVERLGGVHVPYQTQRTLQQLPDEATDHRDAEANRHAPLDSFLFKTWDDSGRALSSGFQLLDEKSIDPRQLAASLLAAVEATSIRLLTGSPVLSTSAAGDRVAVTTPHHSIDAAQFIDCTGAWAAQPSGTLSDDPAYEVIPIKGQMLAVALPPNLPMDCTLRTEKIYIVPRTVGANAGRAIIGATVEDVGFDKTVHTPQISDLQDQAARLLPQLRDAEVLESWAGLRPATPDRLPLLGAHPTRPRHLIATGHYRNGILLAPATAHVIAQLVFGETPSVSLAAFDPNRASVRRRPRG